MKFAATLLTVALAKELPEFESFIEIHGRSYAGEEFSERKALYQQRKADAEVHNSEPTRLWTAGVNKLWDWTEPELKTLRGWDGSMKMEGGSTMRATRAHSFLQQTLPSEKIWDNLAMA